MSSDTIPSPSDAAHSASADLEKLPNEVFGMLRHKAGRCAESIDAAILECSTDLEFLSRMGELLPEGSQAQNAYRVDAGKVSARLARLEAEKRAATDLLAQCDREHDRRWPVLGAAQEGKS